MRILLILTILGIGLVFYLSWVPSPYMRFVWFLPDWIARWADVSQNGDSRTAVPLVFLGLLTGIGLARYQAPWYGWPIAWLVLALVVTVAEAGQLALPHRYFSWSDIAWGTAGATAGLSLVGLIMHINRQFRAWD